VDLNLRNKVVFIAGSTRGIGFSIAQAFLAEGAKVIISGRSSSSIDSARKALSGNKNCHFFCGDMTSTGDITKALDETIKLFNCIDVAVANVGGGDLPGDLSIRPDDWQRGFNLNFFGSFNFAIASVPHLSKTKGNLVFISSIAGVEAIPAPVPYSAAKAAIHSAAKAMAKSLGPHHVRVNVVAPGNIRFPGGNWDEKMQGERQKFFEQYIKREVPMNRFGTPLEIANAVVFLSSSAASFVTGASLVVDGGQTNSYP
jgi:3-oxoacyl-[acyl-carrier protein] reductase